MKINKNELKQLIMEELKKQMNELQPTTQPIPQQQQQASQSSQGADKGEMKNKISQQIRILKFFKETLKGMKIPDEMQRMIDLVKQNKTPEFLKQTLKVNDAIPIRISSFLESPIELFAAVIDEIIKMSSQSGNKMLAEMTALEEEKKESDLPPLAAHDDDVRLEKHKRKEMKKKHKFPDPILNKDEENKK